jgi:hypothetical protein
MFRIGGSAEGITSGLDQTKLTASRPMYKRGRVVNPGGYQGDDEIDRALKSMEDERVQKFIRGERRPQWPQFLTSMGLDLLTRPKAGNIFQQVGASAKDPYAEMMATRGERGAREDKLSAALFGDLLNIEAKKSLQRAKIAGEKEVAQIEAGDVTAKDYAVLAEDRLLADLLSQKREKRREISEASVSVGAVEGVPGKIGPVPGAPVNEQHLENLQDDLADLQLRINERVGPNPVFDMITESVMDDIYDAQATKLGEDADPTEILQATLDAISKMKITYNEGGRVGYQNAGAVMPDAMPRAVPAAMQTPRPTDQGQDDTVQDLSFEELRARLPEEITNDIVKLLSESKQALVDFANIRTQQDVNAFNQKYGVTLVVPQEV